MRAGCIGGQSEPTAILLPGRKPLNGNKGWDKARLAAEQLKVERVPRRSLVRAQRVLPSISAEPGPLGS